MVDYAEPQVEPKEQAIAPVQSQAEIIKSEINQIHTFLKIQIANREQSEDGKYLHMIMLTVTQGDKKLGLQVKW